VPTCTKTRPGLTALQSTKPTNNVTATEFNTERAARENSSLAQLQTIGFSLDSKQKDAYFRDLV